MAIAYIRSLRNINFPKEVTQIGGCRTFAVGGGKKKGAKGGAAADGPKASTISKEVKATTTVGANILKDGADPKVLADSEYPDWLWHLLDKRPALSELRRKDIESLPYEDLKRFVKLDTRARIKENNSDVKSVGVDPMLDSLEAPSDWPLEFGRLQKMIIELWQTCHISLIHRTYFFFLFKGDPMDSIYMEVEVRRLSFLKEVLSNGKSAVQGGQTIMLASSLKAIRRERDMLSRLIYKRLPGAERNEIYQKWGIHLNSKRRRHQLVHHLWSDTQLNHVIESAGIVAKLIGFSDQGPALKEMFGLSITPPRKSRRSFGWKNSMASLI